MSFNIALSGLNAATTDLDAISNNIANSNTTGFKQSRAEFGDFFRNAAYDLSNTATGAGVHTRRVAQEFGQGTITNTGNALDLAISGDGFFTMKDNGAVVYSRAGAFSTDSTGYVVNASGQRLQIFPAVAGTGTFNTGTLSDLQLTNDTNPPAATTTSKAQVNLPASATAPSSAVFSTSDANSYNNTTSLTIYDSLGAAHTQTLYFVKGATSGAWTVHTVVDGTELGTGDALAFDSSGVLTTPANGKITLASYTPTDGAAAMSMTLDLSSATQYGDTFNVASLTQDGYATGELSGVSISTEGVVQARYTNGQATPLGQLAMASFPNEQGLQQLGNASWAQTYQSGQPIIGIAGSSHIGSVQSGGLEGSNVDLTEQLVNMMTAQRNYQANSQVISTTDQLMQTIINLR
jgi:flagellar hook protein FlgE